MMDLVSWVVLGSAALTSLWLLIYVNILLPRQVEERFFDSMRAFSRAVELRFPGHRGMAEDVELLAVRLGREMGFPREQIRRLRTAARLHDIGLCALPYDLINRKPFTQWTEAERATYDRHPEVGGAMLDLVPSLRDLTEVVRYHHARFDQAEEGDRVPIEARVLKVAVEYGWTARMNGEPAAQEKIFAGRGSEFSPPVVDAFAAVLSSSRAGTESRREPRHRLA